MSFFVVVCPPVLPNTIKTVEEAGPGEPVPLKPTGDFFVHDYDPEAPPLPPLEGGQWPSSVVPEDASLCRSFLGAQSHLDGAFTKRTMSTVPALAGHRLLMDMEALSVPAVKVKPILKTSKSLPDLIQESKKIQFELPKPLKPLPPPRPKLKSLLQKSLEVSADSEVKLRLAQMLGKVADVHCPQFL